MVKNAYTRKKTREVHFEAGYILGFRTEPNRNRKKPVLTGFSRKPINRKTDFLENRFNRFDGPEETKIGELIVPDELGTLAHCVNTVSRSLGTSFTASTFKFCSLRTRTDLEGSSSKREII